MNPSMSHQRCFVFQNLITCDALQLRFVFMKSFVLTQGFLITRDDSA